VSFDDTRRRLAKRFKPQARYANFGPILERVEVSGFRGVPDLDMTIESPVIALSGLNGTGKSTVAQLLVCAYRGDRSIAPRHYVKDYFPVSVLDPRPFTDDARVVFQYATDIPGASQQVTVSRAAVEWSGYKRQPERTSFYVGMTTFLPKVERRDFSVYGGARLTLGSSSPVSDQARRAMQTIIGVPYEEADFTRVMFVGRELDLAMVTRGGQRYSENHMGFGEGRMFYLVNLLESAPSASLFVIEEPETSLHGDAQVRLAQYLVEVAYRRKHQIVMTTHSAAILDQLSRESVVYLRREPSGEVSATVGLSTYQVDSYLHNHARSAATFCVEDGFAEVLVVEMLRHCAPDLLAGLSFLHSGDPASLKAAVGILAGAGLRVVGVTDTDMQDDGRDGVMSLPGSSAPEVEVFESQAVRDLFAAEPYRIDVAQTLASAADHHSYPDAIAAVVSSPPESISTEACRAFIQSVPTTEFDEVITFIRSTFADRH